MKISKLVRQRIEELNSEYLKDIVGVPSGFVNIDEKIGGFKKGEFVVIGGRPGMGKSTFAIQMAIQMARFKHKVLYINLNASREWMANKLIAQLEDISLDELQNGTFRNNPELNINNAIASSEELNLSVVEDCFKMDDFENIVNEEKPEIVLIDFLELMNAGLAKTRKSLDAVVMAIKRIARENRIVIIALSQLRKNLVNRHGDCKPQLEDLPGNGIIEESASKVILLYRPEYYDITEDCDGKSVIGVMEANMVLNKYGKVGVFNFNVNKNFTCYNSI
jgi:replicative DNA helicase